MMEQVLKVMSFNLLLNFSLDGGCGSASSDNLLEQR
jgi:hypothetical protein